MGGCASKPPVHGSLASGKASIKEKGSAACFDNVLASPPVQTAAILSAPCLREGWLHKRSPTWPHGLQRRWFVLSSTKLSYYRARVDQEPAGEISLDAVISTGTRGSVLVISTDVRVYDLTAGASSESSATDEAERWQQAIWSARDSLPKAEGSQSAGTAAPPEFTSLPTAPAQQQQPDERAHAPTAKQAKAAAKALRIITKVVAKANALAPRKRPKERDWSAFGGAWLEPLLEHTTLIDARYFLALADAGGIVPRWQELPEAARITPANVWRLKAEVNYTQLPVLVLSYPWLCLLYTSPSPRDLSTSRMPSSA